jgi:GR25 family glycosyltransferase involved in LPS biosynthesis
MQRKFAEHGLNSVQRFPALDGDSIRLPASWAHTPGAYGCLLSHVQVVREARARGVSSVLIFEDDVAFADHLERKLSTYLDQLPADWDMVFFGALHRDEPIKVTENIARITKAYSTYAYVLRDTVFDDFIELNRDTAEELDNNSHILQQRFKCYCFMPHLAWVEADYSDAQERLVDHWYLRESLVPFGSAVDRLLSQTTIVFAHHDGAGALAGKNLIFLVEYYNRFFYAPYISIVIVEQGPRKTIDATSLPRNCKYFFWQDNGNFDKDRCFRIGLSHSDPNSNFFILTENDIYLETLDIRASLRMCERYDCVVPFATTYRLNAEDTLKLRNEKTPRGLDLTKNYEPTNGDDFGCRFLKREAIRTVGDLDTQGKPPSVPSPEPERTVSVFQSPTHALRLLPD